MTSKHPYEKKSRTQIVILFLKDSNSEDGPKKTKDVRKFGASKRKSASNSRVVIDESCSRRADFPLVSLTFFLT